MPGVPVLHGISLTVKHGERIGVVGRTGAGKSTLSLALLRFVEASSGRIVLDGVDISKIGLEDLRRNVTIIPQDPVLFNGTIRFNLDPFNEYPDEVVWDSLRRTRLVRENSGQNSSSAASINNGKHGSKDVEALVVERMSGIFSSLDAEIRENGQNLSLGQRQLVSLARALVRRSRLIIMDEATASVDFDTDDRIQRTIRGYEFANSTLFCIAHRLRTIIDYDRVLVLDKGKVAEFDTPHNLLKNNDGIFRTMCEKSGEYEHLIAAASR
ncbi:P-loop containing nucleoside triphosphate hydrolase protein, partial [Coemansia spiralis]